MQFSFAALSLILESSIAAQMLLFAAVQIAGLSTLASLRGILVLATSAMGLAVLINIFAGLGIARDIRHLNIMLEVAASSFIFLYVRYAAAERHPALGELAGHTLPSVLVWCLWLVGQGDQVDAAILAVQIGYLVATVFHLIRQRNLYRAQEVRNFAMGLTLCLVALIMLRISMMVDATPGTLLRDGVAYPILLAFVLAMSSLAVFTELRQPGILSDPAKYVKYASSGLLSVAELDRLQQALQNLMNAEKLYLKPDLSLDDVAKKLGAKSRDLSQLSNARYRITFPALLNNWRLAEAARQLSDPSNSNPITTIMYDAGFGSKSAFQREFLKKYGVSPSEFRAKKREAKS